MGYIYICTVIWLLFQLAIIKILVAYSLNKVHSNQIDHWETTYLERCQKPMMEPKFQNLQLIIFYHNYFFAAGVVLGTLLDSSLLGGTLITFNQNETHLHYVQGAVRTLVYILLFKLINTLWESTLKTFTFEVDYLFFSKIWVFFLVIFFTTFIKYSFSVSMLCHEDPCPEKGESQL